MIRRVQLFWTVLAAVLTFSSSTFAAPQNGKPAPDFTAKGADGKDYKLSQFKGKTVVLEWFNNDCPYVRKYYDAKAMQKLQKEYTDKGVVWLTVVSSAPGKEGNTDAAGMQKIRDSRGMSSTAILLDASGEVGKAYGAKTTPHMFVIDKKGTLVYQGAIDDRPSASPKSLDGAHNYVAAALESVAKGEPVKTESTTPYGCSVKY